jgi:hypothetical protein
VLISGSMEDKDYGVQKDYGFTGLGAGDKTGMLMAHNEENISITGTATINGSWRLEYLIPHNYKQHDFIFKSQTRLKALNLQGNGSTFVQSGSHIPKAAIIAAFSLQLIQTFEPVVLILELKP